MKLTKKKAKELCILKWEWIIKNNGKFDDGNLHQLCKDIPELEDISAHCGYCEKYSHTSSVNISQCAKCPIRPKFSKDYHIYEFGCYQPNHPFGIWFYNHSVKNAQAVLDLIKSS